MLRQKRVSILIAFLLTLCLFSLSGKENCFTILVGKAAADDASVMMAHNEDDRIEGKTLFVNVHKLPGKTHGPDERILLKNNGSLPQVKRTAGFLWLEIPDAEFGDSYMNENGVVIASNSCPSREDQPELTNGGIGFMLRRLMAERAISARNAVEIAGKLINQWGYYSSGRTYAIADANEAWVLHLVKGKHWIARRVPHQHAAVIANRYTIDKVKLNDKKNYMGSADIIEYAIKRGWYNRETDGEFNFAKVYSAPKNYSAQLNVLRQWRGTTLLAKKRYKPDEPLPFSFNPRKSVKVIDLFRILRDHYEGTEFDLTDDYKEGSPNRTKNRTICTDSTQYAFVTQSREREDLHKEIAHLMWIAFRRPDSNAFSPWFVSITAPPEGYTRGNSENALQMHFKQPPSFSQFNPDYAFWSFAKLSRLVDRNYRPRIKIARKEWRNFENFVMKRLRKMEKEFDYLVRKDKHIALKIITNYIGNWEYRKWFLASELISEMEK
ncbi:MAG: C69 family dipeptidase [Candidatus Aminicenantes bacterium]|nr:MAG: C69 family dipeptidase [Candidatus Aminicenantes bacterium]